MKSARTRIDSSDNITHLPTEPQAQQWGNLQELMMLYISSYLHLPVRHNILYTSLLRPSLQCWWFLLVEITYKNLHPWSRLIIEISVLEIFSINTQLIYIILSNHTVLMTILNIKFYSQYTEFFKINFVLQEIVPWVQRNINNRIIFEGIFISIIRSI